jgi:hypothetical protein
MLFEVTTSVALKTSP